MKKLLLSTFVFLAVGTIAMAQQPTKKADRKPLSTQLAVSAKQTHAKKVKLEKEKMATEKASKSKAAQTSKKVDRAVEPKQ